MATLIPLIDADRQRLTVRLDGVDVRLTVWWQPSTQAWYVSVEIPTGTFRSSGRKLVVGRPVLGTIPRPIPGDLYLLPSGEAPVEAGYRAWRDSTHRLIYGAVQPRFDFPTYVPAAAYRPTHVPAAATVPPSPSRPYCVPGNTEITLHWSSEGNGGSAIISWEYRQRVRNGSWGDWTRVPNSDADTISAEIDSLVNGTAYQFQVRAVNGVGNGSPSDPSDFCTPAAGAMVPTDAVLWRSAPVIWRSGTVLWR